MEYEDFEVQIGLGSGRDYPVAILHSPTGEASALMRFPFDQLALESQLDKLQIALLRSGGEHRRVPSAEEQSVQSFGQTLFDSIFAGDLRSIYYESLGKVKQQGKGMRLKLRIASSELAALPWEFLYDVRRAEYVCLSLNTPVVRYLELPQQPLPFEVSPPLRILGMIANPYGLPQLDMEREKRRVERAVQQLQARGLMELVWLEGQTWRDLQRQMRYGPWHIFHFIGHGGFDARTDEGFVFFATETAQANPLPATQLGRLLADHQPLRLALLNACEGARGSQHDIFSSTAATLVRRGIPAVLAMQYEITDRAAIELSHTFYESLADGLPVDAAVTEARKAVSIGVPNTVEWGTPILYMRSANGVLFDLKPIHPAGRDVPARVPEPAKDDEADRLAQEQLQRALERQEAELRERREAAEREAQAESERNLREDAAWRESEHQESQHQETTGALEREVIDSRRVYIQWVLAAGAASFLIGMVNALGTWGDLMRVAVVMSTGLAFGTAQWIVLRKRVSKLRWWLPASIVGWTLSWIILWVLIMGTNLYALWFTQGVTALIGSLLTGAAVGGALGCAQWFILRSQFSSSDRWIWANMIGWAAALAVAWFMSSLVTGINPPAFSPEVRDVGVFGIVGQIVAGIVAAVITGRILIQLLHQPLPTD